MAAVMLAFGAAVLAAELLLRIIGITPPYRQRDEGDLIVPDADVNYVYTPNLRDTLRTVNDDVEITVNSFGYRDDEWQINSDAVRILVVGNSFTAGYGVDTADRWSDRVEEMLHQSEPKIQVFNAAVSGYNLQQMAATVHKLESLIRPDLVLLGLYLDGLNRLYDPFVYYKGFSVRASIATSTHVENDRLYVLHFDSTWLKATELWLQKHSRVFAVVLNTALIVKQSLTEKPAAQSSALLEATKTHLSDLNRELKQRNAALVVVPIVQHNSGGELEQQIALTNRLLVEYCRTNGIDVVDMLPEFRAQVARGQRFWLGDDRHWNEHAHELAAERISRHLLQNNLLKKHTEQVLQ